jgi:hypothetical protein
MLTIFTPAFADNEIVSFEMISLLYSSLPTPITVTVKWKNLDIGGLVVISNMYY